MYWKWSPEWFTGGINGATNKVLPVAWTIYVNGNVCGFCYVSEGKDDGVRRN